MGFTQVRVCFTFKSVVKILFKVNSPFRKPVESFDFYLQFFPLSDKLLNFFFKRKYSLLFTLLKE